MEDFERGNVVDLWSEEPGTFDAEVEGKYIDTVTFRRLGRAWTWKRKRSIARTGSGKPGR